MMRTLALLFIACAAVGGADQWQLPSRATTVVLVRHAEALPNAGTDPVLSEDGTARANALAAALKDAGVKAVLTTQYQRTILTAQPLAAASQATLITRRIGPGAAGLDEYIRQAADTVHGSYSGTTVVIVGHSNTIPALVKAFSGTHPGEIAHDSYDQMFIVTVDAAGSGRLVRARYGAR
jgi:broad specificity phosphatase PhoE